MVKRIAKGKENRCEELYYVGDNLTLALRIHRIVCFFPPIDTLCCVLRFSQSQFFFVDSVTFTESSFLYFIIF